MGWPRIQVIAGLACTLVLGACEKPPGVSAHQAKDVKARLAEEALFQARLPENPRDEQLMNLPSALMQGDSAEGYSAQQARALSREYQYMREGNQYFAYRRVGNRNEPVIVMRRGRPHRVVYVFIAPYYYYRLVPFYGQYTAPGGSQVIVTIQNFAFRPSVLRVRRDGRVTWVNQDSVAHTATAPLPGQVTTEGAWDLVMPPGQSASRRFLSLGRFEYTCRFHPSMRGTVVVVEGPVRP
ncbi:Amicyanin precursor [compost metagenome]